MSDENTSIDLTKLCHSVVVQKGTLSAIIEALIAAGDTCIHKELYEAAGGNYCDDQRDLAGRIQESIELGDIQGTLGIENGEREVDLAPALSGSDDGFWIQTWTWYE